jgi:hypothetical protein
MLLGLFAVLPLQAKHDGELTRKERKELRRQNVIKNKEALLQTVNNKSWVLEAHTIFDRYGNAAPTMPNTNFVMVSGDQAVIQLAFPHFVGFNGLGGITFDDNVGSYEVYPGKKPTSGINVSMQVSGINIGNASVSVSASPDGNARATVIGPWGWRVTYAGNLVPLEESDAFEGQPLFN